MNHTECRRTIVLDEVDDAVSAHLERCAACQAFAADVERLDEIAPSLLVEPPAGLEERVLAGVVERTAPGKSRVTPLRRPRPWRDAFGSALRTNGVRLTAAAAGLVLIAALVTVTRTGASQTPSEIVLASAQSTAQTGSAEVGVSARTEVVLDSPDTAEPGRRPADPRFAAAPAEMRPYMRREWRQAMAEFERQMEQFLADVDAAIEQGTREMDDALREMERAFAESFDGRGPQPRPESGRRPAPPRTGPPVAEKPVPPPEPPTAVRAEIAVRARGTVDFADDGLALEGVVRAGAGGAAPGRPFRVAAGGDASAYQSSTGEWTRVPGPAGPMGTVLLDPQAVLRVAGAAEGDGESLGEAQLDGETVQRYRLELDETALGGQGRVQGDWTADVYVGADGRLRRMQLVSAPVADAEAGLRWQSQVDLDLSAYGQAAEPAAVPDTAGATQLPAGSSRLLYPLGPSVAEALDARATQQP